jgi:hypothetical protein
MWQTPGGDMPRFPVLAQVPGGRAMGYGGIREAVC